VPGSIDRMHTLARLVGACCASALSALLAVESAPASLSASFLQRTTASDGAVREREGEVAVRERDGRMAFHWRTADGDGYDVQRWCSDGRQVWLIERPTPDDAAVVQDRTGQVDAEAIRKVVAALRLDRAALERDFIVDAAIPDQWRLTPRPATGEDLRQIELVIRDGRPERSVISLGDGQRIELTVRAWDAAPTIPEAWFAPR
jgi:outer membrane lipoprotein-sorting protein